MEAVHDVSPGCLPSVFLNRLIIGLSPLATLVRRGGRGASSNSYLSAKTWRAALPILSKSARAIQHEDYLDLRHYPY